jgi:hypothetical protein
MLKYRAAVIYKIYSDNYSTRENTVKATVKKHAKYMLTNKEKQIKLSAR